ncbi:MAG TPA: Gfo/Idh/MocA family oxidoreductase, partial [Planctomycetota bacterium]|nr:Gfo/Idh/MocA family oxidoreductase [Planctomycetota bacterium]
MAKLKWGILGTGNIAKAFATGVQKSKTSELVAVGSRSQESADKFGAQFNIKNKHASYEALLADPEVQAVYICTPHPMHAEWAIKTAEAKKHILCEKPIGINHAEAMAITEAAIRNDVFFMEAFMYRCHPQTKKLVELIREKVIGDVRVIQATFSFHAGFNEHSRIFANSLAGGGILDVGCYCTSMAGLIAGAAQGKEMADPIEFKAVGHNGPTGVDHWTVAVAKYPGNIVAQLSTGVEVGQESVVRIFGSAGNILVPSPWFCSRHGDPSKIIVNRNGKPSEEVIVESGMDLYSIEADTVAANVEKRQAPSPAMTINDSLSNMRALDAWREQIGLEYEAEKWPNVPTVHRRPLTVSTKHNMTYGTIPGLSKKVSRLVMGVDNQRTMPHAAVMFDDFIERGGNCFDTAYVYGGG